MKIGHRASLLPLLQRVLLPGFLLSLCSLSSAALPADKAAVPSSASADSAVDCTDTVAASPYIPLDSWIYPAVLRLYSLGVVDRAYLGLRPWTRESVRSFMDEASNRIDISADAPDASLREAQTILNALSRELAPSPSGDCSPTSSLHIESLYTASRFMSGTPLRDSFHLGSTVVNDYGRPYANGANNYTGISGYASYGRYLLYARGELQAAPSATGYSTQLAQALANIDYVDFLNPTTGLPYQRATTPLGPIDSTARGSLLEAYAAVNVLNHMVSFGKHDQWLGPGVGGAMAYSNNADNIYAFEINRVAPLDIPGLSRLTGPFRYEFAVGPLKGHAFPNSPWAHFEKISFKPTPNLEFGFERTVIWGGKGHEPITLHTFLRSFFSTVNVTSAIKNSAQDPGARFGAFDFTYRLPFLRNWLTLYTDSEAHDDVSPIDAPRRASYRPGLYLSHLPRFSSIDLRAEGVSTDPPTTRSNGGQFNYYEAVQRDGYTNSGQLFGDWIGREGKGGQAWATWHLSGNEWVQLSYRHQKSAKDFIPGGTTLNDVQAQIVKRIHRDYELTGNFVYERWKAPIYQPGTQTVTSTTIRLAWYPDWHVAR
jgi:hypothetical protein